MLLKVLRFLLSVEPGTLRKQRTEDGFLKIGKVPIFRYNTDLRHSVSGVNPLSDCVFTDRLMGIPSLNVSRIGYSVHIVNGSIQDGVLMSSGKFTVKYRSRHTPVDYTLVVV